MSKLLSGLTYAAALSAATALFAFAQPPAALPEEAAAALRHFLDVDCEIDERGQALQGILKHKNLVEPRLLVLLREGPDKATLDSYLRAVDEQWQRREAFLKQNPELGLGKEDLERAHRLTKEEYVTQAREQFIRKYREKAAIGLAAIGSDDGRRALRETAARQGDPLQDFVRPILTKPIGK